MSQVVAIKQHGAKFAPVQMLLGSAGNGELAGVRQPRKPDHGAAVTIKSLMLGRCHAVRLHHHMTTDRRLGLQLFFKFGW